MALNSLGDLSRGMTLQLRSSQIRNEIETLSQELSTGRVTDVPQRLQGSYAYITDIDRNLARLKTFSLVTSEARQFTETMQTSLATFGDAVSGLSSSLLATGSSSQAVTHEQASTQADNALDTLISALNSQVGGRNLFSGTATDTTPLASGETLLSSLRTQLVGATSAEDVQRIAEDWFNDPTGFEATIYQGASANLAPIRISENEAINLPIRADNQVFRSALRDTAVAALASDPTLSLSPGQRTSLLTDLGVKLAGSNDATVNLRAQVGAAEARIEQAATRNAAARTSLEHSKTELIGADPYETATRLQNVQAQLESLYTVTVRNSNLSLVNFLR